MATGSIVLAFGDVRIALGRLASERTDLNVVDALARLRLAALRLGGTIIVCDPDDELKDLLDFVGLSELRR